MAKGLENVKEQLKNLKCDIRDIKKCLDNEEYTDISYMVEQMEDEVKYAEESIGCAYNYIGDIEKHIDNIKCSIAKLEG